ncbi:hypothetical protein C3495_01880 [Clostridiaceae bacterium 14S0207]|nr:hypothetical protein C3495_01880 [Clostridiaceae bacterium 14S0207]
MYMKKKAKCAILTIAIMGSAALTVSAYHFRGYFSRNVGYGNRPAVSDYVYKMQSSRNWVLNVTSNKSSKSMRYELVNSNGENRGTGKTSSGTFRPTELSCSGQQGNKYKLKVTKMADHNPMKAYSVIANWDTDANK